LTRFSQAVREELWVHGRLVESRLSHGEAIETDDGIVASDVRDDALVEICDREMARLRAAMPGGFTVRLVAEANTEQTRATMTVRDGVRSIVTSPEHLERDLALLSRDVPSRGGECLLWRNGSGAILLHEAFGHPLEHAMPALPLPDWLRVDVALSMRRATFRDVPLLRMQHVRVSQAGAPFALPPECVEIHLVDGGSYEPLTDVVTIRAAVPALEIVVPRKDIVFVGAEGEPVRYPGVICSREGQELVVDSYAPTLITAFR
jgi:hypothetical protein